MSSEQNRTVVRRFFDEAFNQGNLAVIDEVIATDWINLDPSLPSPQLRGREGARQLVRTAFPDIRFTIEDAITEGDKVALRVSFGATHKGEFMGMPPTGKRVNISLTGIFRVVDGMIAENWVIFDALGMMQQLDAVPVPEPAAQASRR